jgi:hypothetical protein
MSQTAESYLADLGAEILALARESQREATAESDGFEKGRRMAFYEVLSLMKQQAAAFGLPEEAVGLQGVDPEDLLA